MNYNSAHCSVRIYSSLLHAIGRREMHIGLCSENLQERVVWKN